MVVLSVDFPLDAMLALQGEDVVVQRYLHVLGFDSRQFRLNQNIVVILYDIDGRSPVHGSPGAIAVAKIIPVE